MAVETDFYVIGRMALWAGDLEYAESQFSQIRTSRTIAEFIYPSDEKAEPIGDVDHLILYAITSRLKRIQGRQEERKRTLPRGSQSWGPDDEPPQPIILTTTHLRALIWRIDDRRFQLRCFLTDLNWETELLKRARVLSANERAGPSSRSTSWESPGEPFMRIGLSDSCLLRADAFWYGQSPPTSGLEVRERFMSLLTDLDGKMAEP